VNFFEQSGKNFYLLGNFKKIVLKRCSCKKDGDCQNRNDNQFLESVFHVFVFFEVMELSFSIWFSVKLKKECFILNYSLVVFSINFCNNCAILASISLKVGFSFPMYKIINAYCVVKLLK